MSLLELLRLIAQNIKIITINGVIVASLIFVLTRGEKKVFSSETLINTGLVTGYKLESGSGSMVDREYTGKEMQNIINVFKAYETREEVCMRLLAKVLMLEEEDPNIILQRNLDLFYQFDFTKELRDELVRGTYEETYENVLAFHNASLNNKITRLLASKHDFFSIAHVSEMKVNVQGNSDILKLEYTTTDPGICIQTLEILSEVATRRHQAIKNSQSGSVVEYFKKETEKAFNVLEDAELELLAFRKENNIINYYEQTRYISARKENLFMDIREEKMRKAAADSAVKRLEAQLMKGNDISKVNNKIASFRDELSAITAQIARSEIQGPNNVPVNTSRLGALKAKAAEIKEELKAKVEEEYNLKHSVNGIAVGDLLTEWLEGLIMIEEASARLSVAQQIRREFDEVYRSFAPLGSIIKKIERKIDVSERAYLETLHSLNQAKLHEKSLAMSANLKVLDQPYYPKKPAPSARPILIVVGLIAGVVLTIVVLIVMEFLDKTLKTPKNTIDETNLKLFTAYPKIPLSKKQLKKADYDFILNRCTDNLLQNIKLELKSQESYTHSNQQIAILSTQTKEGKTTLISNAVDRLRKYGDKVLYVSPKFDKAPEELPGLTPYKEHEDNYHYEIDHELFEKKDIQNLLNQPNFPVDQYNYIFIEIPALLNDHYPIDLVANSNMSLLICRANRVWDDADKKALKNFKKGVYTDPFVVLNGTKVDVLESIIGEIPKKRGWIRRQIKRLITLGFKEKREV